MRRIDELCQEIQKVFSDAEKTEEEHAVWRTRRNTRVLLLLRAIEIFAGNGKCPVCGSPSKWPAGKKPSSKQLQDLHDDKCELDTMIRHFEHCLDNPGVW